MAGEAHWAFDFRAPVDRGIERALGPTSDQCAMTVIGGERDKHVQFTALPASFFDLEEDPAEFGDQADDPAYRGLVPEYARKVPSWRRPGLSRS